MIENCMLRNRRKCAQKERINHLRSQNKIRIVIGYDWNTSSDNIALIYDILTENLEPIARRKGISLDINRLGGKDGSIYCDICYQIQTADIALFDISTHNVNVIFEAGLAIASGAYVFMLRSRHQKKPKSRLSDLNGIMEYRFTRRNKIKFDNDLIKRLVGRINVLIKFKPGSVEDRIKSVIYKLPR